MRRVWKYEIAVTDQVALEMPYDATPLTVQVQHDTPCLWVLVDPNAAKELRRFRWVGTGHPVDFTGEYVGTIQGAGGSLVFHLFSI